MRLAKQISTENKKTTRKMSLRGYLFSFLTLCFIMGSIVIVVQWANIKTRLHHQIAEAGFKLENVMINGRNHTTHQELKDTLKLQNEEPILSINLNEKRLQIEQLGWVESAYLERLLPNTLRLTIIERTPIALLQTNDGHQLIDNNGAIIAGAAPEAFSHLPVVSGEDAAKKANHLIEILKTEPELYAEIWAIQHISKRRWNVHMKNGITIKLPENGPSFAWSRLARFEHRNQIIQRDLAIIDMRLQEQILIEPNLPIRGKGQET